MTDIMQHKIYVFFVFFRKSLYLCGVAVLLPALYFSVNEHLKKIYSKKTLILEF